MSKQTKTWVTIQGSRERTTWAALRRAGKPEHIVVEKPGSTLFTMYRPARRTSESPVAYYRRLGCVDDRYARVHKGRYYCNPAHCSRSWKDKAKRDEHLEMAYAILG